jgi:hypothetical protein
MLCFDKGMTDALLLAQKFSLFPWLATMRTI